MPGGIAAPMDALSVEFPGERRRQLIVRRRAAPDAAARGGSTSFAAPAASIARGVQRRGGTRTSRRRHQRDSVGLPAGQARLRGFTNRRGVRRPQLHASAGVLGEHGGRQATPAPEFSCCGGALRV
jgi:hypothetical protein